MNFNKFKVKDEKYNKLSEELGKINDPVAYNAKVAEINEYTVSIGINNRKLTWEESWGKYENKTLEKKPSHNGLLKIWEKNGRKRGYLKADAIEKALGLEVERYKTGHPKHVTQGGYEISNSKYNKIINKYDNQYYDFVSKSWSFAIDDEEAKSIDKFFRGIGEIR